MVIRINLALPLFFYSIVSQGQPQKDLQNSPSTNHVVIGAFASQENATHFTDEARERHPDVKFDLNPARQLFYVFVEKTDNRVRAFAEARRLRKESKYWDTWVYFGTLGEKATEGVSESAVAVKMPAKNLSITGNSINEEISANGENLNKDQNIQIKEDEVDMADKIKAYSMGEEPTGIDLNEMIVEAQTQQHKDHYEGINEVKNSASKLDAATKVIVFKDDEEGRKALRSLGYDIEEGKSISGFFDSENNILAINATEAQADEPFHEGLKPVVKFLKKKDPELFETFAQQASTIKHPIKGVTYGELTATDEEALANMMEDVAKGYFENSVLLKGEATTLMKKILETLGVEAFESAVSSAHLKTTATNLAIAVREATGFDADGNRKFRFYLHNTMNMKKVNGEVDLVNEAGRKLTSYPGNEKLNVKRSDASGNIILACEVLGYRKLLFKLNYDNPFLTEGVTHGEDEEAVVSFGLVRLQKGDIAVMYNVYFFKDAAIMRPESRYEMNNLLSMMNENSAYKIRIHGHTNGNSAGKIITMGDTKSYFSMSDTKEGRGSAKKLSEERAKVIREYLTNEGISEERMEIKAWGGKRPLYDKHHSLAQSNVRVEVEIIEN